MKNNFSSAWLAIAIVAVLFTMGCQPSGVDHPPTFGVTGTITLDGAALEGATVTFVPAGSGNAAVGTTDASGKYTLQSFGSEEGATPGQYKVKVAKYDFAATEGGAEDVPEDYTPTPEEEQEGKSAVAAKYQNADESGLTATVTEDASQNVFDFALEGGEYALLPVAVHKRLGEGSRRFDLPWPGRPFV